MNGFSNFGCKVAMVTGGAQGMGRGIARRLKAAGAHVVIAGIERPVLRRRADDNARVGPGKMKPAVLRAIAAALAVSWIVLAGTVSAAAAPLADVCGKCRVEKVATCGGFLEGPVFDAQGRLWVADLIGARILLVEPSGDCTVKAQVRANGLRRRADGSILIAGGNGLMVLDPATGAVRDLNLRYGGKPLPPINDLALDAGGGVYFTVPDRSSIANPNGRVFYLSPAGEVRMIADGLAYPNGVVVLPDGEEILVSEFGAKRIISLPAVAAKSPFSMAYVFAFTRNGVGVDGMALDGAGRVFGANLRAREVLVFDPQGRDLGAIALPEDAGSLVTNVVLHRGYLYITEAAKGEVWRVRLRD